MEYSSRACRGTRGSSSLYPVFLGYEGNWLTGTGKVVEQYQIFNYIYIYIKINDGIPKSGLRHEYPKVNSKV